jgi:hypothetical protein
MSAQNRKIIAPNHNTKFPPLIQNPNTEEFTDDTGEKHTDGIGSTELNVALFLGQKCHEHP